MTTSPPSLITANGALPPNFMTLFCARQPCSSAEFEKRVLGQSLYWHARLLSPFLRVLLPGYFKQDSLLIGYLAKTPGTRDAMNELAAYMETNREKGGLLRNVLCLRISARKASKLIIRTFAALPSEVKYNTSPPFRSSAQPIPGT